MSRQNFYAAQYRDLDISSSAFEASPHELIAMLYKGALEKIGMAKASMQRGDIAAKAAAIASAACILDGLRMALDKKAGGEIAQGLDQLYDWLCCRLVKANVDNDLALLTEAEDAISIVSTAWNQIPQLAQKENSAAA